MRSTREFPIQASERNGIILNECLCLDPKIRSLAIVGAGGKTSLMYYMAHCIAGSGGTVVTTTTTKIFPPRPDQSPQIITNDVDRNFDSLNSCLKVFRHATVSSGFNPANGKLLGVDEEAIERCLSMADYVLIEADGAAGRSIKAPEDWEPVIPGMVDLVISVVGLDCLDKPVSDDLVFRMERFSEITGLTKGHTITPEAIGRLLSHPRGGFKGAPPCSDFIAFLNKKDLAEDHHLVETTANVILEAGGGKIRMVIVGSVTQAAFRGIPFG